MFISHKGSVINSESIREIITFSEGEDEDKQSIYFFTNYQNNDITWAFDSEEERDIALK